MDRFRRHWPLFALAALALAVFSRTAAFGFVRLDDHDYTFLCPFVRDGLSFANLGTAFSDFTHAAIWMPLTYLSYMLGISAFGPSPAAHHAVNVTLHALNAMLAFTLFNRLLIRFRPDAKSLRPAAFFAVALWTVHPLCAESVAWIAARKELLWVTFALAGLLAWEGQRFALGAVAGALACLSKPTAVCFPLLALALDFALDRVSWRTLFKRECLVRYIAPVAFALATALVAAWSQTHAAGYEGQRLFVASFPWRLGNAIVSLGLYLRDFVLPLDLHVCYRAVPGGWPVGTLAAAVAVALAAALFASCRRARGTRLAIAWFLFALLPVLGVLGSFGEQSRADRFAYFPSLALAFALAVAYSHALDSVFRSWTRRALAALVALAAVAGWAQAGVWRDDYTLFSHALACDARDGRARAHVASELIARFNRLDEGIAEYRRALESRPHFDVRAQLGFALAMRGAPADPAEVRHLLADVAADPKLDRKGMALDALGIAAAAEGRAADAVRFFEASLRAPRRFYPAAETRARLAAARKSML